VIPSSIEEQLEIEAIKKLRSLYSHHLDAHEFDELALLFTEDAICDFTPRQPKIWVGRQEIRTGFASVPKPGAPAYGFRHGVTNPWIELSGSDAARGRWLLLDLLTEPQTTNALLIVGIYDDEYRKVDGAWFLHRTRIDHLWQQADGLS
jgi:hypothetical protein